MCPICQMPMLVPVTARYIKCGNPTCPSKGAIVLERIPPEEQVAQLPEQPTAPQGGVATQVEAAARPQESPKERPHHIG